MDSNKDIRTQSIVADMLNELQGVTPNSNPTFSLQAEPSVGSSPDTYIVNGDVLELGEFDYEGYQVVRREFFAHTNEPSITFNNYKVYVNAACLNRLPSVDFVQVLVNSDKKVLAIRPCKESERDAFSWCSSSGGKRKAKQVTCKLFFAKVFALMDWNPDHRYKLLGKVIHANDEYLIAFDMTSTEVYQRVIKEGEKPKTLRKPVFPEGWQDQFGLPFKEHQKTMQINIFDGYAVYGIKDAGVSVTSASNNAIDAGVNENQTALFASGGNEI